MRALNNDLAENIRFTMVPRLAGKCATADVTLGQVQKTFDRTAGIWAGLLGAAQRTSTINL